jgi:starch synthase
MYAQRFGSLPIGRQTGGLSETIVDGETGFLFSEPSAESLLGGISRAFTTFRMKARLNRMRERAMSQRFGWRHSARNYAQLYRSVAS